MVPQQVKNWTCWALPVRANHSLSDVTSYWTLPKLTNSILLKVLKWICQYMSHLNPLEANYWMTWTLLEVTNHPSPQMTPNWILSKLTNWILLRVMKWIVLEVKYLNLQEILYWTHWALQEVTNHLSPEVTPYWILLKLTYG